MSLDGDRDRLGRELRALPRLEASAGFRSRVLDAASERRMRKGPRGSWVIAAFALGAAFALLTPLVARNGPEGTRDDLTELRREHRLLRQELQRLRSDSRGATLVYVGGDEERDYVIDLKNLDDWAGTQRLQPTSYSH